MAELQVQWSYIELRKGENSAAVVCGSTEARTYLRSDIYKSSIHGLAIVFAGDGYM